MRNGRHLRSDIDQMRMSAVLVVYSYFISYASALSLLSLPLNA